MQKGIEHATRLVWSAHGSISLLDADGNAKCGSGFVVHRRYGRHVLVNGRRSCHEMSGLEQSFVALGCSCSMMIKPAEKEQRCVDKSQWYSIQKEHLARKIGLLSKEGGELTLCLKSHGSRPYELMLLDVNP